LHGAIALLLPLSAWAGRTQDTPQSDEMARRMFFVNYQPLQSIGQWM
jgi:hypothetical protein